MDDYVRQNFVVRSGMPTDDGAVINVISYSNSNMTITVNGNDTVISSWTTVGNDAPYGTKTEACFQHAFTITGLSPFTQYTYTATQDGETQTQTFYTNPASTDEYTIFVISCDRGGGTDGAWRDIYQTAIDADEPPVVAILYYDDIGYMDAIASVDDRADTGHYFTGTGNDEYSAAIAHLGFLGMTSANSGGLDFYRHWCQTNINIIYQYGNHEFVNGSTGTDDFGTGDAVAGTTGNSYHSTLNGYDGHCLVVWNRIFAPLQGTQSGLRVADTNAQHWKADFNSLNVIASDFLCNYAGPSGGVFLGTNQITDILNGFDTAHPFKMLITMHTGRDIATDALRTAAGRTGNYGWLGKYNMTEIAPTEFDRLFVDDAATPSSLMLNTKTNGTDGKFIMCTGDMHLGLVGFYKAAAGANKVAESFYQVNMGRVGSVNERPDNYNNSSGLITSTTEYMQYGYDSNGVRLDWVEQEAGGAAVSPGGQIAGGLSFNIRVDVNGALPRMTVRVRESEGYTAGLFIDRWTRVFTDKTSNDGGPPDGINIAPQSFGTVIG